MVSMTSLGEHIILWRQPPLPPALDHSPGSHCPPIPHHPQISLFLYPLPSPTLQAVSSSASRVFQVCDNQGLTLKTEKEVMERWTQVRRYWIPINMNLYFIFLSDLLSFNIQIQTPLETNCYWVKNCLCTLKEYFVNANSSPAYMCLVDVCVCIKGWYFRALEERVARERVRKIITKQGLLLPLCTPVSFLQGVWVIG